MVPGDGDAQRDPRVGHDVQPLRLAPSRGALLPGIADKTGLKQLGEILVDRGQAQVAVPGECLPGAEVLRIVDGAIDAAARRGRAR